MSGSLHGCRALSVARRRRSLASLAILLQLTATTGTYLHQAVVRHEVCSEHGELIHGGSEQPGAAEDRAPESPVAVARPRPSDRDEHDPCGFTALLREHAQPDRGSAAALLPAIPSESISCHEPSGNFSGSELYELAPKTSPPPGQA